MTATILNKADTSHPESSAVTFILAPRQLVTVRYADPLPFQNFRKRIEASAKQYDSPGKIFEGLIDAIVERLADILEKVGSELDSVSLEVFTPSTTPSGKSHNGETSRRFCEELGDAALWFRKHGKA